MARTTIEELERILNSEDERDIVIEPDGSIRDMTPEEVADRKADDVKIPLTFGQNLGGEY